MFIVFTSLPGDFFVIKEFEMRKIIGYRKLLGVNEAAGLQELKTVYRNLMKEWHPDKYPDNQEMRDLYEAKSKHIIEAYHFLVSIAPETRAQTFAEFTVTTSTSAIADFDYKDERLQLNFSDGNSYEWFGIPKALYVKMVNAPALGRFVRRHIYTSFPYRSASKVLAA
jgi:curved DNA-binding protein CbpA